MLQEHPHTSLFSFGSREVKQRPAIGIADLRRVSLLQHSPDRAHVPRCHRSLDLQLLVKLWVPSAVMVQHPVTVSKGRFICISGQVCSRYHAKKSSIQTLLLCLLKKYLHHTLKINLEALETKTKIC